MVSLGVFQQTRSVARRRAAVFSAVDQVSDGLIDDSTLTWTGDLGDHYVLELCRGIADFGEAENTARACQADQAGKPMIASM